MKNLTLISSGAGVLALTLVVSTTGCFERTLERETKQPGKTEQVDRDGTVLVGEAVPVRAQPAVGRPIPDAVDVDGAEVEPVGERQTILDPTRPPAIDSDAASTEHADPTPTPEPVDLWNGR